MMRRGALILVMLLTVTKVARAGPLLLELWINGRDTHVVARVLEKDGKWEISNADLADAGLAVPRNGTRLLDASTDIRASEDEQGQRLLLTAAATQLSQTTLDLRPSIAEDVTPASPGASLRYDLSATTNDAAHLHGTSSAGTTLALTLFRDNARFTATGFATTGLSARSARLDTALEFDTPSAPRRLILGDAITGVPQWARNVRFGGIEIATDFSQQPDRVTFPLPQFFGMAALPSTVDVFVGASRAFNGAVQQGPFALNDLPVMTGGGSATVVVRDVLGRETTQAISLYTDPTLLMNGLMSYAVDAGFLRRDYGIATADYATPFLSGTWRRGLRDVTAEAHGEFAQSLALVSAGMASALGGFGAISADIAVSRHGAYRASMASLDLSARAGPFSFYGDVLATAGRFFDLAALSGEAFPRFRYDAGISASLRDAGALSFGWIGGSGETRDDLLNASYSLPFGNGLYFGLTGFRDFSNRSWAAQMFFSMPLDSAIVSTSASTGSGDGSAQIAYDKPVNPDGGFGYGLRASTRSTQRAQADVRWIADYGELDGAAALTNGQTALRINASGGLVWLDDRLFAARAPDGAVALVEAGAPDVRIYRENRVVAHSGPDGDALVTGLNPYARNRIGVEPRDYPLDADVAAAGRTVVPPRGAGVVVNLAPVARHSFVAVIRLGNGVYPPVGAIVRAHPSKTPLLVGRDGEVYLSGLTKPLEATVETRSGRCRTLIVPPPPQAGRIPRAGPFLCSNELADAR